MKLRLTTLAGWLVAPVGGVVLAWLFGLPELAALAVAVGGALCVSTLWLASSRPPEVTAVVEPPTANLGDPATLRLDFRAPVDRSSTAARLWGRLGSAGEGIVAVARLGAGDSTSVGVVLPTPMRGIVRIGPLALRTNDPLRLFHTDERLECDASLLVRPRLHQLPPVGVGGGRRPAPGRRSGSASWSMESDSELVGLRPYVRGDDVRRIHWRTSARLGEPHVVQVEPPVRSPATTVLLDQSSDSTAAGFERAVSAAASVLVAAAGAGRSVRLVTLGADGSTLDSEPTAAAEVGSLLDTLATVSRFEASRTEQAGFAGSDEETVVWCTASTSHRVDVPAGVDTVVSCDEAIVPRLGVDVVHVAWTAECELAEAWLASTDETPRAADAPAPTAPTGPRR